MEQSGRKKARKINEGGACRLIRNDVSVNRHINFQSVFFHFFFSIHDIYLFCVRCRSAGAPLLLEHKIFSWKCYVLCARGGGTKVLENERRKEGKWKGADWEKLRKINIWVIRKHKYWMVRVCECEAHESFCSAQKFYSSLPILKDLWNFLCIQFMAKAKAKWRNFPIVEET